MRTAHTFSISNSSDFKKKLLSWSESYNEVIFLDSNDQKDKYSSFEALLAVDADSFLSSNTNSFERLKRYRSTTKDWLFGYFSYDLKNELEDLKSTNFDNLYFPELYFFCPKKLIIVKGSSAQLLYMNSVAGEAEKDFKEITIISLKPSSGKVAKKDIEIKLRISKEGYFDRVGQFLEHIQRGDIYEANFCQEFYAVNRHIDPITTFLKLNEISEAPFATFLKIADKYLISATPERYLKKFENKVISQPIKGTAARSQDREEDTILKKNLEKDEKERSENIMITDLVRNDLSKLALKGTVNVEELCKVYSFKQVHQVISTISAQVHENADPLEIIKTTFPMGSMTGAPKIAAMQIIDYLEQTKRGLYSGAVGYFTPNGDFDLNVVIRSILYNAERSYVSFSVGSAITAKSDPEKEYQECLLKAKAMRKVLEND